MVSRGQQIPDGTGEGRGGGQVGGRASAQLELRGNNSPVKPDKQAQCRKARASDSLGWISQQKVDSQVMAFTQ